MSDSWFIAKERQRLTNAGASDETGWMETSLVTQLDKLATLLT